MKLLFMRREYTDKNRAEGAEAVTVSGGLRKLFSAMLLALLVAVNVGCGSAAGEGAFAGQTTGDAAGGSGFAGQTTEDAAGESGFSGQFTGNTTEGISLEEIPAFEGDICVTINGNVPYFTENDCTEEPFERYSEFDELGRCGVAFANICQEIMPTEERGPIGHVRPSGWHTVKYDNVDGNYLFNRCHLIGFQLAGENANEQNLITGTRYLNTEGMLPFENEVADYVKETGNHVLYRVTPMFEGDNLVADGVLMEAWSVEDDGAGVCFNVFVYNVQPGIGIDFATGESWKEDKKVSAADRGKKNSARKTAYVLNTNTMKFHDPSCSSVSQMSDDNKQEYKGTREALIEKGYEPCGQCRP